MWLILGTLAEEDEKRLTTPEADPEGYRLLATWAAVSGPTIEELFGPEAIDENAGEDAVVPAAFVDEWASCATATKRENHDRYYACQRAWWAEIRAEVRGA
jgi:hypothetical protein